ncbi:NAD(P)-binding protein [Ganoderma leucocontextum]|nr:NAD(P)-binding protein [Ganoderma leucocontextum]
MQTSVQITVNVNVLKYLSLLGIVLAIPHLYRILDFCWLYFLRPSSVKRYLHGNAPYAIVTGATDGIGKATAAELLTRGFNLILHGRNEAKMQKVVEELRAAVKGKGKADTADIRYFLADAAKGGHDFAKLVEPFRDLHVTVVMHNVGGSDLNPERIDERTEEFIMSAVNKNAFFSLLLTRTLLPQLRRAAHSGPVQVVFVGSVACDLAPARLPIYAASKGFLQALTRGLDNDERFFGVPTGVSFTYLAVGAVHSDNHDAPILPSLTVPTSARFGRAVVESIGCGRRRIAPYYMHAMQSWSVGVIGESVVDAMSAQEMKGLIAQATKEKGKGK